MGMQVSYRVQSKISEKDHLLPVEKGYTAVYPGFVQMERRRNHRRKDDA